MDFTRLFDILPFQAQRYPQKSALVYRKNGVWQHFSTTHCLQLIQEVSAGLHVLGVKKGDNIALLFETSTPYWNILDVAISQLGAVVVPLHSNVSAYQLEYILSECEVQYCFVSSQTEREKIKDLRFSLPHLKRIFLSEIEFSAYSCQPNAEEIAVLESIKSSIKETDLATIVYTSGTTGSPKGVMLSHLNIVSNIKAILPLLPLNHTKTAISFLPLSHIFERVVTYTYMVAGASLYYINSIERVSDTMREVRPHYFSSVPRLLEKTYENILSEKDNLNVVLQKIFNWAIKIGQNYESAAEESIPYIIKKKIADWFVYRHWRNALGGRVEGIIVGAAALHPSLGRLFTAANIPIREGYGMTETSPVIAFNRYEPGGTRFGTVGIPLTGVNVRIDMPDNTGAGEILVQGPNVMLGYYKKPLETKAVMVDGWLRTGDVGKFVHKRFLQLTDRKKDIFKTSHGKYVSPMHVENHLRADAMIEQCMIYGANKPFVVALIVPSFTQLKKWCAENKVHWTAPQYMIINPKVEKMFIKLIFALNEDLENHERIQKYILLFEEWTIEGAELTPTLKLRRSIVTLKHQAALDELY